MAAGARSETARTITPLAGRLQRWPLWLAFFLVVVGARLWLVALFGSSMPILDQWDDEGGRIFKPYLEGTLRVGDLFVAHNEHRPVLSRLLALLLLIINRQWDARVQMSANAVICGFIAGAVACAALRIYDGRHRALVIAAVTCWLCLPYAWENTTSGFQSSFYFLLLFSLAAIWGLLMHREFTLTWALGAAAAVVACFTMASGFLCAAAVLLVIALRLITARAQFRHSATTVIVSAATVALGIQLRTHVPDHDVLGAASTVQWLEMFGRCLAWPFSRQTAACLLMYAPMALLLGMYLRRRKGGENALDHRAELLLACGAWVALQSAAIAYSRGAQFASFMSPRYMDVLALGAIANFFALLAMASGICAAEWFRQRARAIVSGWAGLVFFGVAAISYANFGGLRDRAAQVREAEKRVRTYVASGDMAQLAPNSSARIAYPWPERFAGFLNDPTLRSILASSIRIPLTIEPETSAGAFSVRSSGSGTERAWTSEGSPPRDVSSMLRSGVLRPAFPYLRFELHGALRKNQFLKLETEDGRRGTGVRALGPAADGWRSVYAAVPSREIRVLARDDNPATSFEFREPTEVGRLSYYAECVLDRAFYLLAAGLATLVGLSTFHLLHRHCEVRSGHRQADIA